MSTGEKRTRHTRRVRADRLQGALATVAQAVSQTLDLEQLLDIALDKVLEVMDLDKGVIYLIDAEAREIVLKAHRGVSEEFVSAVGRMEVAEADMQRWQEQREPAFGLERMFDPSTLAAVEAIINREGMRSYVGTSLWSKDVLRGVMVLGSRSERRFSPEELELLYAIGNQIAVAIENAELFEQTRARAEEFEASEAKYRRLAEDINDGYVVVTAEGRLVFANAKMAQILGYKLQELTAERLLRSIPEEFYPYLAKTGQRLEQRQRVIERLEGAFLTKDGERVPVEMSFKPVDYEGERAIAVVVRDITERKQAEEELRESEEKYRHLFEGLTDAAFLADAETGLILETNVQGEELLGKSRHEIVGMHQRQLHPLDKADEYRRRFAEHIEKGHAADYDGEVIKKDGTIVPVRIRASTLNIGGQHLILGLFRDITERKRAEEAVRESEERLRALIDNAPDGIWVHDLKGKFIVGNKKAEELVGYSREELMAKSFLELGLLPEEYLPKAAKALEKSIKGEPTGPDEFELIRKDGSRVSVEITSIPVERGGTVEVIGIARDITERKRAEEERALLYQETKDKAERLAVTAELTHIIVSSLNIEDVYEAFVDGVRRLVDFDRASIAVVEGDRLRLLVVSAAVETELGAGATMPLEESATAWVVAHKKTNIETDFAKMRQFPTDEALVRSGLRSAIRLPLFSRGEVIGTFNLASRRPNAYGQREQEILEELAGQIAVAIENDRLFAEVTRRKEDLEAAYEQLMAITRALERSKDELEDAYLKMARTLVITLEARDPYTRGHSERVAQLSRQIAYEMNLPPGEVKKIETAARLHDLGKIGIPDGILLKPNSLTPSERAEIQLHPRKSVDMLRFLGFLNGTLPMIEGHHERYDGRGYPDGLKGEETPRGARILAVADAYDAMTSARPYRPAMTNEQAIKTLKEGAGSQWDPEVVDAFLRTFGRSLSEGENAD